MADPLFSDLAATTQKIGTNIIYTSGYTQIGRGHGWYAADALATPALATTHPRFAVTVANNRTFRALPANGVLFAEQGGAVGDGVADDTAAVRASFTYADAIRAGAVSLESRSYKLSPIPTSEIDYHMGPQPSVVLRPASTSLNGGNAQLKLDSGGCTFVFGAPWLGSATYAELAADVAAGDVAVTLTPAGAAALAVGDEVLWQLGELPFDTPETLNWGLAKIIAKSGNTVTLDKPIPEALTLSSVTGVNKRLCKIPVLRDFVAKDLVFAASQVLESGFLIQGGERLSFARIGGRNIGAGLILAQYCDGITISDCWQEGTTLTQASYGAAFSFAECRNVQLIRPRTRGTLTLLKCEAGAEAQVVGAHFDNTITNANGASLGAQVRVFHAVGRGKISAHDTTVTGHGGYVLAEMSNGYADYDGHVRLTGRTRLIHPTDPWQIPLQQMSGTLDMTIGSKREIYNLDALRHWRRRFTLRDGQYLTIFGPSGILVKARAYVSSGVTIGANQQLTAFTLGRQGDNGGDTVAGAFGGIAAGVDTWLDIPGGSVAGTQWTKRALPMQITCVTAGNAGLDATNAFVEFEGWFAEQDGVDQAVPEAEWRMRREEQDCFEARAAAHQLPSIAAGERLSVDLPISDMAIGDIILGVSRSTDLAGLTIHSAEALNGAARLHVENQTEAAIGPVTTDLHIAFAKPMSGS